MIRILHVVSIMDVGGMESYIMNMYRRIDRSNVQFDFLVHHARRGAFEDEIESLGGHVYHTTLMDDFNLVKYLRALIQLFKVHPEYKIVHGHLNSSAFFYLGVAKKFGVKYRILHCHCPGKINTFKGNIKHVVSQLAPLNASIRLACSTEAGKYLFKRRSFEVIPNGVDAVHFRYNPDSRSDIRRRTGTEDQFVIGHVGRFYYEKNHEYILDVFKEIKAKIPNAALMLLGEGKLMGLCQEKAQKLGIAESVHFIGLVRDCAPYYHAMDVFMMPSLYEGLPLSGIEAQFASLPCLFSNTVSHEVKFSSDAHFLPIGSENISLWVDALMEIYQQNIDRTMSAPYADKFDSTVGADKMITRYKKLLENEI